MKNTMTTCSAVMIAAGLLFAQSGHAFDMGNVMNPSKWMGGNNDRDRYDDYYDRGYGYPGGPGYGGPGYAPGYYGGAPGYGYGAPAYGAAPAPGYGGAPGYGAVPGQTAVPAYGEPAATDSSAEQIEHLQDRVRVLEEALRKQQTQTPAPNPAWGSVQPGYSAPATPSGSQSGYQYR